MKLSVDEDNELLITEAYSGVGFKTLDGEMFGICMRDTGYEFNYMGKWYEAKNGRIVPMKRNIHNSVGCEISRPENLT